MADLDPNTIALVAAQLTQAHVARAVALQSKSSRGGSMDTTWSIFESYRQRLQPETYTGQFAVDLNDTEE